MISICFSFLLNGILIHYAYSKIFEAPHPFRGFMFNLTVTFLRKSRSTGHKKVVFEWFKEQPIRFVDSCTGWETYAYGNISRRLVALYAFELSPKPQVLLKTYIGHAIGLIFLNSLTRTFSRVDKQQKM
jgi:hypothetical protein